MLSNVQLLDTFLEKHPSVKVIKLQTLDISATLRCRLLPIQTLIQLVRSDGIHPGSGSFADVAMPVNNEILHSALKHFSERAKIVPDLSSLRMAAHDSARLGNTAIMYANVEFRDTDARAILAATVARAEREAGLEFVVGTELEFSFIEKDGLTVPSDQELGLHNNAILSRSRYWPILNQITVALAEAGINVYEVHKEYAPSEFEIALPPGAPVEAVDISLYAKEVIRDIAYQHGLRATFFPDPFEGDSNVKNGQHIHISATPIEPASGFDADQFLGGLLNHIPALCAIGMAQIDSYSRAKSSVFGVGTFVAWGDNNREVPVRRVSKNHWELRCNDATSNTYAMVTAIIAAGLDKKPLAYKETTSRSLISSSGFSSNRDRV